MCPRRSAAVLKTPTTILHCGVERFSIKTSFRQVRRGKLGVVGSIFYEKQV